jgi:hypothetical protein
MGQGDPRVQRACGLASWVQGNSSRIPVVYSVPTKGGFHENEEFDIGLDPALASKMEPRASSPRDRLETIRQLTAAGIPVTVMTAPIIPGLNDHEVPAILEAAREAGATMAGYVLLRLPYQIKDLFLDWLKRNVPLRAQHVASLIRQTHGGELYDASYFTRQRGEGHFAAQIRQNFTVFKRRYHLDRPTGTLNTRAFRRPQPDRAQLSLFDLQPRPATLWHESEA